MSGQIKLVDELVPMDWDSKKPGNTGFKRVQFLQSVSDIVARPVNNRTTAQTNATAVNLNGTIQSTGVGTAAQLPSRFAEFLVKARATFNISGAGALYVYVMRTTGAIPANGAAPNAGDVAVAGDAFAGPATVGGQNVAGSLAFIDQGLNQSQQYRYYFAFSGTNGLVGNLVNASQIMVSEF